MRQSRRRLSDEERAAKREKERELVEAAVEQLRSSEGWQSWIESRSRFRHYSLGNQFLIAIQDQDAVRVAGFAKWVELGYLVKRGEHGLKIWAPIPPSKDRVARAQEARRNGEETDPLRTFFKLVPVFGDDQVEPISAEKLDEYRERFTFGPQLRTLAAIEQFIASGQEPVMLAPPVRELEGDDLADAWEPLVALVRELGGDVMLEDTGRAGGYLRPGDKHIGIAEGNSVNARVKTLIHETAHLLVRAEPDDDDAELRYAQEELIVESVALTVTGSLGFPSDDYSIGYLTSWSEDTDIKVIERCAGMINRMADRIEGALEAVLA